MSEAAAPPARWRLALLFGLLGFAAGLPFYLFSTVLALRLARNGIDLATIGFFAWVTLLPTFKFLWAPLVDRYAIPGFARFWGRRRSWILAAQLGIATSMAGLGITHPDTSLGLTAFWAVLLAFWTTTLEIAADAWRIEVAPTAEAQGPLVSATLWGYRSAMVAAGSGALILADSAGWIAAYLAIALVALAPFPLLVATRPEAGLGGGRWVALTTGLAATAVLLAAMAALVFALGWLVLGAASQIGVSAGSNVTPFVLIVAMAPFVAMAIATPRIAKLGPAAPLRTSPMLGPYVDIFWRYGLVTLALMAFVSLYRMGDVLALTLSKPLVNALGYTLTQIGVADGAVALASSMVGVGLGGWVAARWRRGAALASGAALAALGNFALVWLAWQPPSPLALYVATGLDQFGNGFAGTVFVVYLSLLVNPRFAGAQYAFLSGFAFLLPRLVAGSSGVIAQDIGYAGFFALSGALSLAAILLLPWVHRPVARSDDA
ncbi:MFS transporter [Sphingomonas baiyangensis]|uniref:AmpG family muropeptide MFS transporter n=1 Tax=Sphingomonas baiyangensis TaxID=2572576 RepID=A0A4U1L2H1_9SPHN|nr:AmpG family muropeptide MFS transporter [Sphingomonas baiyangensis]TKD51049.1 AmpG family muropeptide MFS transporter [Sphingomonas baiyangensis]